MDKESVLDGIDEAIVTMEKMLQGLNPYNNEEPSTMGEADIVLGMRENWGVAWHALNAVKNHIKTISEEQFETDEIQETYGRFLNLEEGEEFDDDDFI